MTMKGKASAAKTLSLDSVLDLNAAGSLHTKLMALRGRDVVIDASAVERVGALCLQVLMSASKTWEEEKFSLTFSKMSDALTKTMQLSGVNYGHMLAKESNS
jgi:chemotaxis protein CheX